MSEVLTLTDADIERAAARLQVEPAAVKAVVAVESRGHGFLPSGKVVILFEAHLFSKFTAHKYDDSHPHISSREWDKKLYRGGEGEWERMEEALLLNKQAALQSASYGLFQVLGANYRLCGFLNVEDFVAAQAESEGRQLDCFVTFCQVGGLDRHLRTLDFANFARKYNGPRYAEQQYDVRLKRAYDQFSANK